MDSFDLQIMALGLLPTLLNAQNLADLADDRLGSASGLLSLGPIWVGRVCVKGGGHLENVGWRGWC